MPHNAVKIIPGVDTTRTIALNEAALSSTNLVRLVPDRQGLGLVQKLGGWSAYFDFAMTSPVRALKGWMDLNNTNHLAIGCESSLNVLTNGNPLDITPLEFVTNTAPVFSTTSGSNVVTVTDANIVASTLDFVEYITPVSVGGLILQGPYALRTAASTTYSIYAASNATATEVTTNSVNATSLVANKAYVIKTVGTTDYTTVGAADNNVGTYFVATGPATGSGTVTVAALPAFKTTASTVNVTCAFNNHGFSVGDVFTIFPSVALTIGGVTLSGNYIINDVPNTNTFTFPSRQLPSSTAGYLPLNNGNVRSNFYIALGPQPTSTGYGVGGYGVGGYGSGSTQIPTDGTPITARDWTLDNFGQILIACPLNGPIYYYDPTGANQTAAIVGEQAPLFNDGIFVSMPQRQVVAWGSSFGLQQDPLLIRWSDIEDFSVWVATSTNQAGSYRLPSGSMIMSAMQAYQQGLFWTDLDLWAMQYIGPPFVYGFNKIGSNCGAISQKSSGQLNNIVYWMSQKQFFRMAGSGVEPLPCPIWDVIFQNLKAGNDPNGIPYTRRIRCAVNSQFNEITWYYPSASSTGENDSYVKYNVNLNQWDFGELGRSAWIDQSTLGPPIGAGTDNFIYQHETTNSFGSGNQQTSMLSVMQTGYFALSEADQLIFIDQIWPDMKWGTYSNGTNALVYITFFATNYPGDPPTQYGPYEMTQATEYISVRIRARLMSIQISSPDTPSQANQFWRLGNIRYRFQADGRF